jgi:hypothetical protein
VPAEPDASVGRQSAGFAGDEAAAGVEVGGLRRAKKVPFAQPF